MRGVIFLKYRKIKAVGQFFESPRRFQAGKDVDGYKAVLQVGKDERFVFAESQQHRHAAFRFVLPLFVEASVAHIEAHGVQNALHAPAELIINLFAVGKSVPPVKLEGAVATAIGDADSCHTDFFRLGSSGVFIFLVAGIHRLHCVQASSGRQSAGCTYCADLYKLTS